MSGTITRCDARPFNRKEGNLSPYAKLTRGLAVIAILVSPRTLTGQGFKIRRSLQELETAAQRDSNDAAAQYGVAIGYWTKKRYDDAERALRLSVAIEPRFAQGWLALGVLPFARRPKLREDQIKRKVPDEWKSVLAESERLIRHAFLIDPLVDLWILAAVDPQQPVAIGVVNGRVIAFANPFAAFEQGRYRDAFAFFDAAIYARRDSVPRDSIPAPLLWYHGLCAAHLNMYAVTIEDFQTLLDRALARERGDSLLKVPLATNDYRYMLALMYQRQLRWLDALQLYRAALENDLGLYMAHVQLARLFKARGMLDSAVIESRKAVETNPEDPSLLLEHGVMLTDAAQLTAAEDTLRRAMEANPRDSRVPYYLGLTLEQMNKRAEARAAYERFLTLAPSRMGERIAYAKQRLTELQ